MNLLLLGGTTEAYELARSLRGIEGYRIVTSLAGRTREPRLPAGEVRIGGFGGAAGLAEFLREQRISAVMDATHPFAAAMGWNAAAACRERDVPLLHRHAVDAALLRWCGPPHGPPRLLVRRSGRTLLRQSLRLSLRGGTVPVPSTVPLRGTLSRREPILSAVLNRGGSGGIPCAHRDGGTIGLALS
jgi:hypothetical protein